MPTPWLIHRYGASATAALRLIAAAYLCNWRAFALFFLGAVALISAAIGFKLADVKVVDLGVKLQIAAQVWLMLLLVSNFFMLRDCFAATSPELADIGLRTA